jgi:hypothetical protein
MASRDSFQHRLWLAAFVLLQLAGLWQWHGAAGLLRRVFDHAV